MLASIPLQHPARCSALRDSEGASSETSWNFCSKDILLKEQEHFCFMEWRKGNMMCGAWIDLFSYWAKTMPARSTRVGPSKLGACFLIQYVSNGDKSENNSSTTTSLWEWDKRHMRQKWITTTSSILCLVEELCQGRILCPRTILQITSFSCSWITCNC
jgi:hypothetical protein